MPREQRRLALHCGKLGFIIQSLYTSLQASQYRI
jgi:hypothetical protein